MNSISFNKNNGELSWKCFKHGYCTCNLYDLFLNENEMLNNFDNGCGYCE